MADINNNYRNQYKTKNGLDETFQSYWSKSGIATDNNSIKVAMEAIAHILSDDISKQTKDRDFNQTIFDRTEFKDLCRVVGKQLEEYLDIDVSDTEQTLEKVRKQIRSTIEKEFQKCLKSLLKTTEKTNTDSSNSKKISKILTSFFARNRKSGKKSTQKQIKPKEIFSDIIAKFTKKLSESKKENDKSGQRLFKEVKNSNEFKVFLDKCKQIMSANNRQQSNSHKIKNDIQDIGKQVEQVQDKQNQAVQNQLSKSKNIIKSSFNSMTNLVARITKEKTVPFVNSVLLKNSKHLVQTTENSTDKIKNNIFLRNITSIGKQLKNLGSSIFSSFGLLLNATSFIFSPITSFFKGAWNAILHPVQSLKKIIGGSSWLVGLLKFGLKNPANAFMLGAFSAMAYNMVKTFVYPLVDHYVTIPALKITNMVMQWLNPEKPGTIANIIMGLIDVIRHPIQFIKDLVKPVDGIDPSKSLISTIFVNFARKVGVDFPAWAAKLMVENADVILKTIMDLHSNQFMVGFLGSTKMSWLLKPMMYLSIVAGNALGKIYKTDGKGTLSLSDKIKEDLGISKKRVQNELVNRFLESNRSEEDAQFAKDNINALVRELNEIEELNDLSDRGYEYDGGVLPPQFKELFIKSKAGMFGEKLLSSLIEQIAQTTFKDSFENLPKHHQIAVLKKLLELRQKKASQIYDLYKSNDVTKNLMANEILRKPVTLQLQFDGEVGSGYQEQIKTKGINHRDGYYTQPHVASPGMVTSTYIPPSDTLGDVTLDFSTDENQEKSMAVLSRGIDANSKLAQYLKSQGIEHSSYTHETGLFRKTRTQMVKFNNTAETKNAIYRFLERQAQQTNEEIKQKAVAEAFVKEFREVRDAGAAFALVSPSQKKEQSEFQQRVIDVIKASEDDVSKIENLKKLVDEIFSDNDISHAELIRVIEKAYVTHEGAIIINSGVKEIGDLEGAK